MVKRISALSLEELAGAILLAVAVLALAANTDAFDRIVAATSTGASVGVARMAPDAEDRRMRAVRWIGTPSSAPRVAQRVVVVGEPCVPATGVGSGEAAVVCARLGWALTPR